MCFLKWNLTFHFRHFIIHLYKCFPDEKNIASDKQCYECMEWGKKRSSSFSTYGIFFTLGFLMILPFAMTIDTWRSVCKSAKGLLRVTIISAHFPASIVPH